MTTRERRFQFNGEDVELENTVRLKVQDFLGD